MKYSNTTFTKCMFFDSRAANWSKVIEPTDNKSKHFEPKLNLYFGKMCIVHTSDFAHLKIHKI